MIVWYAGIITLVVVVLIVLLALYFALRSPSSQPTQEIVAGLYKIRSVYFVVLLLVVIGVLTLTLTSKSIPYEQAQSGSVDKVVKVVGQMWFWEIEDDLIPTGKVVEFQVSSKDVNHGFGIYSPEGKLLAQTQAMPGYINKLRYKFEKPGEYHILCLEYCGQNHHAMMRTIDVK